MKILVLCETSNEIAGRFRAQGHNVTSCDLLPNDIDQTNHWQGDVMEFLETIPDNSVDLIIAHPECTALAVSGNAWYGRGMAKENKRKAALDWTENLWNVCKRKAKRVCFENPVSVLSQRLGKPQYIQPWMFGHLESKKTGLWLHNLPEIEETNNVYEEMMKLSRRERMRLHYLPPSKDRWKIRSKTFSGIADAIVSQFSNL
jgi:hypothetical protein